MKKHILIIAFLLFALARMAEAQSTGPQVRAHTKLQNSVSFETRMKENGAFSKRSAKEAYKIKKAKAKAAKRKERKAKSRNRIYLKTENL